MKYPDPQMQEYFMSLPSKVRAHIIVSKAVIASPGELRIIGEHFKNEFGPDENEPSVTI